ncbi:hypothetical protein UlMin_026280 [Ulmus minor]
MLKPFVLVMSLLWWNLLIEQALFLNVCHPILSVTLLRFHGGLMPPHPPKMVASIVKRLKDPNSVIRDACLETVGIMASESSNGLFLALLRPLFEAMGEQNKQLQAGLALSILQWMLNQTSKLLKNPHFMAKPTVIQLNTRGAPTQIVLSSAMSNIQESLGEIASGGGYFLGPFMASYIQSLESHWTLLQALHCWKTLPGHDTSEPSEAGSSLKENYSGGDYSDLTSESGRKDVLRRMVFFFFFFQMVWRRIFCQSKFKIRSLHLKTNEMMCIRKHLLQIEDKQSNLVDLLQVFSPGIMENLSMLQSRVVCLKNVVDRLSQDILQKEHRVILATSKLLKQGHSVNSPRFSTCTTGPSIVICNRQYSLLSMKNTDNWEDNAFWRSVGNNSSKQALEMWKALPEVLSSLAFYLLEQRFINSIVPWLQQVVELGTTHGPNYLVLSTKARQTLLSAVLEAVNMDFLDPLEKRFVNQIAVKLHHICLHWK